MHSNYPLMSLVCTTCGSSFSVPNCRRSLDRKFCSRRCSAQYPREPFDVVAAFWAKVEKTESCWLWRGALSGNGYGSLGVNGKTWPAHRYAWLVVYGEPIEHGLFVCHTCDVRLCVRREHLFIGTCKDNIQDAKRKGRLYSTDARGEDHNMAKLNPLKVGMIRRLLSVGYSQKWLAGYFGVTKRNIQQIGKGNYWRSVGPR